MRRKLLSRIIVQRYFPKFIKTASIPKLTCRPLDFQLLTHMLVGLRPSLLVRALMLGAQAHH